jgi:hypothetical protein
MRKLLLKYYQTNNPINKSQLFDFLADIFTKIASQQLPQMEYSLWGKVMLNNFETFFLPEFNPNEQILIKEAFLSFCNNL